MLAVGGLSLAAACLPDLGPLLAPAEVEPPPALRFCGDGFIATLEDGGDAGESCDPGDAQAPGCSDCKVTCSGTIDDAGANCYFALTPTRVFNDAVRQCANAGAHLVTLSSDREAELVDSIAAGSHWVGLFVRNDLGAYGPTVSEPGYPLPTSNLPCAGCYGRGADGGVFPLASDVDASAEANCIVSEGGGWFRGPCISERTHAVVCEREPVGLRAEFCGVSTSCTTVPATAGRKTYVVSLDSVLAREAEERCRLQRGTLVVLSSRAEREQLVREITQLASATTTVWIGLSRTASGPWTWDDGTPDDGYPSAWGSGQPEAGAASRAYLVTDENVFDTQLAYSDTEGARRFYVCERAPTLTADR